MTTLAQIIAVIETLAPPALAAEWDNSGLQVGDPSAEVDRVMVALDPLPEIVSGAAGLGAGLLVSHHPLFFRPLRGLDLDKGVGATVGAAVKSGVAVYSAHTSLDRIPEGVSYALAKPLGLRKAGPLDQAAGWPAGYGYGRIGDLPGRLSVAGVAAKLKAAFGLKGVRLIGDPGVMADRVAVCGGSGADFIGEAASAGADIYITGDVKYHDALKALELGIAVLDIGHFGSEMPVVPHLAGMLKKAFGKKGWDVEILVSKGQAEPWSQL
ncbi:MAG: Nif3-like dinuclear metal center hexameric protein [Nitrospirae bacterium]|nr:Nif3-like dinuclear metal center hexameric protein [Nitrospirota bacterium]